jgi:uncharacterized protein YdiU (UPF0061 family)
MAGLRRKIGLVTSEDGDSALVNALLDLMQRAGADYTVTFRRLCDAAEADAHADTGAHAGSETGAHAGVHAGEHADAEAGAHAGAGAASNILVTAPPTERATWFRAWRSRLARDPQSPRERARSMRTANPAYIPRNHRVEAALSAATAQADFGPFHEMLLVLSRPYEEQGGREAYLTPPLPSERVLQTFCGT